MGRLTTHVLDTARGAPAAGLSLRLYRLEGGAARLLREARTNADGRADGPLLEGEAFHAGRYRLEFEVGAYFAASGSAPPTSSGPAFLGVVPVEFGVADAAGHYHVPLLVAPFGYSTYRGS